MMYQRPDIIKGHTGFPRWQFISQGNTAAEHLFYIRLALDLGCRWIQLRLKEAEEEMIVQTGHIVRALCAAYEARFILNDHVGLVKAVGATGVHLGLTDMRVEQARRQLGEGYIIGGTANTGEQVAASVAQGVDYIGLGPYRFTRTKKKLSPVLGINGYQAILREGVSAQVFCPIYAIGGIELEDLPLLGETFIDGVAVSGWLTRQAQLDLWRLESSDPMGLAADDSGEWYLQWRQQRSEVFNAIARQMRLFQEALTGLKKN